EAVVVPAGTFFATKVILEEEWRAGGGQLGARWTGGRPLTLLDPPGGGRAVEESRRRAVAGLTPIDPNLAPPLRSCPLEATRSPPSWSPGLSPSSRRRRARSPSGRPCATARIPRSYAPICRPTPTARSRRSPSRGLPLWRDRRRSCPRQQRGRPLLRSPAPRR